MNSIVLERYEQTLSALKYKIHKARTTVILSTNIQLLAIYWEIGGFIIDLEKEKGWGSRIIEQLALDLKFEFPDFKGLSARNLRYMRNFHVNWPELGILQQPVAIDVQAVILQQPVAKLPWGHICVLNDRLKDKQQRDFYAIKAAENNWSRNVLLNQIDSDLYQRHGKLQHNFNTTLPHLDSDLARDLFKDPYKFDFIQLSEEAKEKDLEDALINHLQKFLTEMGKGFAFYGRQYRLEKGDQEYFIDLLFYHTKLHCYIALELKIGEFKPEYSGKMNFYLSVIDDDLRSPGDGQSIGLILCKNKNKITAEYALKDMTKPIGIAEYEFTKAIPKNLKGELPSIEDIEHELEKSLNIAKKPFQLELDKLKTLVSSLKNEELKEVLSPKKTIELFSQVLPRIMNFIDNVFSKEIYPQFDKYIIQRSINGNASTPFTSIDLEQKATKELIHKIGIVIEFKGFKAAGTKAFNLFHHLIFTLNEYNYQIGLSNDIWEERLYHHDWSDEEIQRIAEKWMEHILQAIRLRLMDK